MARSPQPSRPRGSNKPAICNLGLVCITHGPEVRYRTITRTRLLSLPAEKQIAALTDVYQHNLAVLFAAMQFCRQQGIRLYRVTSGLFPQLDHPAGQQVFTTLKPLMGRFAAHAQEHDVRVVIHPDQFVVLNSLQRHVVANSLSIMRCHAMVFDALKLPRTPWSAMILHGGKGGRAEALMKIIPRLPAAVRNRLVLENDESCYSAGEILEICRGTGVPMVFDAHHHVVYENLDSYEHESVAYFTEAAAATWPDRAWQLAHISNGQTAFADSAHHDLIHTFPTAYRRVPWVEVEAKHKELAIAELRRQLEMGN